jgi:hypothetical protein
VAVAVEVTVRLVLTVLPIREVLVVTAQTFLRGLLVRQRTERLVVAVVVIVLLVRLV